MRLVILGRGQHKNIEQTCMMLMANTKKVYQTTSRVPALRIAQEESQMQPKCPKLPNGVTMGRWSPHERGKEHSLAMAPKRGPHNPLGFNFWARLWGKSDSTPLLSQTKASIPVQVAKDHVDECWWIIRKRHPSAFRIFRRKMACECAYVAKLGLPATLHHHNYLRRSRCGSPSPPSGFMSGST